MAYLTVKQIAQELNDAIALGKISNGNFKSLSFSANTALTRARKNLDWPVDMGNASNAEMKVYWSTVTCSVGHIPSLLKKLENYPRLALRAAVLEPYVEVAALLNRVRPLVVKGRASNSKSDRRRLLRLEETKTCQYCGGAWKATPTRGGGGVAVIAHHGYQRPQQGSGIQTKSCPGARYLPYEICNNKLPSWIEEQEQLCRDHEASALLYANHPVRVMRQMYVRKRDGVQMVIIGCGHAAKHKVADTHLFGDSNIYATTEDVDYEARRLYLQREHETYVKLHKSERDRLQKRLDSWTMNNTGWRGS